VKIFGLVLVVKIVLELVRAIVL